LVITISLKANISAPLEIDMSVVIKTNKPAKVGDRPTFSITEDGQVMLRAASKATLRAFLDRTDLRDEVLFDDMRVIDYEDVDTFLGAR
jgi:hypothetical protein